MNVSPSLFGEQKLIEVDGLEAMNDAFLADGLKYGSPSRTPCWSSATAAACAARSCSTRSRPAGGRWWTASP